MATEEVISAIQSAVAAAVAQTTQQFTSAIPAAVVEALRASREERSGGDGGQWKTGDMVEKLVRRTTVFGGEGFQEWKFRAEVGMVAVSAQIGALARAAEIHTNAISRGKVDEDKQGFDSMLYYFLTAITKGEAFDLVKNVSDQCGSEAWRKLCKRYGGKTKGKRVVLTRRCVNPPKVKKLSDTPGMVEKWEADMRRLEAEYGEKLSDGLKCGILLEMVPIQIGEFITQRVVDEDTYEDTKETVLRYVETKADFGPTPMDLDALKGDEESSGDWGQEGAPQGQGQEDLLGFGGKGYKGVGGAKGGGGKGGFQGMCHTCGEWGHRAAQCPWKQQTQQTCYHCGQAGHILSQCPAKTAEMKGKSKGGFKGYGKGDGGKGWSKGKGGKGGKGYKGGGKGWLNGWWEEYPGSDQAGVAPTQQQPEQLGNFEGMWGLASLQWHTIPAPMKLERIPPGLHDEFGLPSSDSLMMSNRFSVFEEEEPADEEEVACEEAGDLLGLFAGEPLLCNMEGEYDNLDFEWICVETVVDSGAADTVGPMELMGWLPLVPSEGSKRGQTWKAAGGEVLPNLGERRMNGVTEEGHQVSTVYQIAEVGKALGSVARMCDKGNRVVFEADGGYIMNLADGRYTRFERKDNVYVMSTWVKRPRNGQSGFQRRG